MKPSIDIYSKVTTGVALLGLLVISIVNYYPGLLGANNFEKLDLILGVIFIFFMVVPAYISIFTPRENFEKLGLPESSETSGLRKFLNTRKSALTIYFGGCNLVMLMFIFALLRELIHVGT